MRIIVTGAASGIGRATARLFAERPHDGEPPALLLVDRERERLAMVADELLPLGARVETAVGDLADPEFPVRVAARAEEALGGIDVLVSNAGAIHAAPIGSVALGDIERLFAVNARATLLLAQATYPALRRARGAVVATASIAAHAPAAQLGVYSASKAALVMLVRQMALEWGPDGIRCNTVSPGPTHTAMTARTYDDEEARRRRAGEIPLRRVGTPEDVAHAIHFLAGPGAAYVTGIDLPVDGGLGTTLMASRAGAAQGVGK
jgi:glucose 1-dehydrogenase